MKAIKFRIYPTLALAHKPEDSGNAKVRAGMIKQTRSEQAGRDAGSTAYPAVRLRA